MKTVLFQSMLLVVLIIFSLSGYTQSDSLKIDSLKKILLKEKEDTNRVNTLNNLSEILFQNDDSVYIEQYANEALSLSGKLNFENGKAKAYSYLALSYYAKYDYEDALKNMDSALAIFSNKNDQLNTARSYYWMATFYATEDNYGMALENYYSSLKLYEVINDKKKIVQLKFGIATTYFNQDDYPEALNKYFDCIKAGKEIGFYVYEPHCYMGVGTSYFYLDRYDDALKYDSAAFSIFKSKEQDANIATYYYESGKVYQKQANIAKSKGEFYISRSAFSKALTNYLLALKILTEKDPSPFALANVYINLGKLHIDLNNLQTARNYLEKCLQVCKMIGDKFEMRDSYKSLSDIDSIEGRYGSAYSNYRKYIIYRDSISNKEASQKSLQAKIQFEYDKKDAIVKAEQIKKDSDAKRIKNQQYFIISGLGVIVLAVLIISLIQFRNNKQKQKANLLLESQKQKIETTLSELRSTQSQLIQSEKMASLGELTAGIAHEIQNPLNFVNNFSEVNKELLNELKDEANKGNIDEVKNIADDVIENSEKINHHGKRADAIVKGMLEHSRSSTGVKQLTDINALADEYLRLSYHGLRAKDKNFNAEIRTDLDSHIEKINMIPQDIGRVLLNLYNNAFYAVNEKKKASTSSALQVYQPIVSVTTKKINNRILLTVMDNGNGIPQKIVDKIFQPFFTTKPTGQGTGLGLSLSYDIIKAHGGEIKVETKEGEGTEFIILLPAN